MKKTLLLIVGISLFSLTSFAQGAAASGSNANGADKNFHFGLNITPGLYWVKANGTSNAANGSSFGFGYGVNLEFYFTQNYGFVTGLEIASFGANYTNTNSWVPKNTQTTDSITAHSYKLQYLEIPLMLKFRTQPIGMIKYFGIVGLNPGIRLKATDDYTVTGNAINPAGNAYTADYSVNNVNINSQTSIIRLAFVIGAGLEYNLAGTTSVQAALCYDSGFLNINSSSSNSILSKGVTLTIGVLF